MSTPIVSVVMSVFNAEKYLNESIESILNQTYRNFEFIIIDDGSTDSSLEIIKEYANNDNKITVISRENRGLIASLNDGIRKAQGKYIARMDADDIAMPMRFEKQVALMESSPEFGICGTGAIVFGEGVKSHQWLLSGKDKTLRTQLLFSSPFIHPSVMMRNDLIQNYQLFYDKNFLYAEDFELWTRFAEFTQMTNIMEPLLKYRIVEKSASRIANKEKEQRYKIIFSIVEKYIHRLGMELSSSEKRLHFLLSANVLMKDEDIACQVIKHYFKKIIQCNTIANLFNEKELKMVLGKKWLWYVLDKRAYKAFASLYTIYGIRSLLSK